MKTLDVTQLKPGDILSETSYYVFKGRNVNQIEGHSIVVTNHNGLEMKVGFGIAEDALFSASQFTETKKVTKTELARLLTQVGDTVFQVSFMKQAEKKVIKEALTNVNGGRIKTNNEIASLVDDAYKGELRVLRGFLSSTDELLLGRVKVVDLDIRFSGKGDPGYRLVDLRTIQELITKNVKYILQ
jgi:hypothetical protein